MIHFENFGKLLERDLDVSVYIEEHISLRHNLSKISHRFRIFLIFELLVVTASQFVSLLETTGNHQNLNFANGGNFLVNFRFLIDSFSQDDPFISCFIILSSTGLLYC